ncbi:acetyl-CoA carboxylase biotin carboxyl carrier protein [Woodsholea maritima]|uniref:acetyl-CoA carboxylase biotin carboxyl carrier protein n=1 Tax=Woodsholea maritima TaxID=240237 RepID=UPI0003719754|nr:acetyl-CoA carboxylase biotin carboxyl carrier protein [Woodsholea maritima]
MASNTSNPQIDSKLVRELADILKDTELTEIEVEKGELRIRVAKEVHAVAANYAFAPQMPAPMAAPAPAAAAPETPAPAAAADAGAHPGAVKSPMVGTVYLRANPDSEPFKKVGDSVKEGETVLLVEAMKTFNPITAPKAGTIKEFLVDDAQPVEYGEPLFIIA